MNARLKNARFGFIQTHGIVRRFVVVRHAFIDGAAGVVQAAVGVLFDAIGGFLAVVANRRTNIFQAAKRFIFFAIDCLRFVACFRFFDIFAAFGVAANVVILTKEPAVITRGTGGQIIFHDMAFAAAAFQTFGACGVIVEGTGFIFAHDGQTNALADVIVQTIAVGFAQFARLEIAVAIAAVVAARHFRKTGTIVR